jgi:hypothetical protein
MACQNRHKVALGEDAGQLRSVNDRQAADLLLSHECGGFAFEGEVSGVSTLEVRASARERSIDLGFEPLCLALERLVRCTVIGDRRSAAVAGESARAYHDQTRDVLASVVSGMLVRRYPNQILPTCRTHVRSGSAAEGPARRAAWS